MLVPNGTIVAVADGEKLNLYRNAGDERDLRLADLPVGEIETRNKSAGVRHISSAANPDESRIEEDSFAAGVASLLNEKVLSNTTDKVVIVAAPRTLGELRKHYHKELEAALLVEISKDLTGHSVPEIEKALLAA